jgi:hypothetical protein
MAGSRRGGRRPVPEVDDGRCQVPLSTFYSASQGQDEVEGSERRPRRARRPPPEPTDSARGTEDNDELLVGGPSGGCERQPMETDASGAGSSWEAAMAAKVYLRGPARLPQPPLSRNRPVIRPQGQM